MSQQSQHIDFTDLQDTENCILNNETGPKTATRKHPKFRIKELLDGTILVRENMIRQLPYCALPHLAWA